MNSYEYLLKDINKIKGIGIKISKLFKKKNINTIFDLLWNIPRDYTDRTNLVKINELHIGKIQTIRVTIIKYYFPRIKNLPKRVICEDNTGKIECVFFNSYDGYIKKVLPINSIVTISGKVGFYKNKYQITNPTHVSSDGDLIKKITSTYSLTEGLNEKKYNNIINHVLKNIPDLDEWLSDEILKKFNYISWKQAI
ncbi:OB-fold nucleic acid binding domain-containing protein, partial [Candidatus Pelagibacter sp.]|nr:OB-fold nucleic acid binding domain-containing protein [Candidatus Pelagibacter sp.]